MGQIGQKFEYFLETYRRPDGSKWGGQDLHNATGGVVTRSYVTSLRKGRIENPGYEKLAAIAKAMGFPPTDRDTLRERTLPTERQQSSGRPGDG